MGFFDYFDLSKQCDACGRMVGGGVRSCPKCKIAFCHQCSGELAAIQVLKEKIDLPLRCPMCKGNFESPKNRQSFKVN